MNINCNLLHLDLMSFMGSVLFIWIKDSIKVALKIFYHLSMTKSNIIGMISPSSNIDGSVQLVQLLNSSTYEQKIAFA